VKHRRRRQQAYELKPEVVAALCREVMPIGGDDLPTRVVGWRAGSRWRRFQADYPNGFRLSFSLNEKNVPIRVRAFIRLEART